MVIKNSNGLCAIYFIIFSKVLVRRVVLNFYIHKELFGLIDFTFEIFYAFVLDQKALEISRSDLTISNVSCTLVKLVIYLLLLIKRVPS